MRSRWCTTSKLLVYTLASILLGLPAFSQHQYQQWVGRYDGPIGGADILPAIAADSSGNAYVTGSSEGKGSGYDYCTIKYSPTGTALWTVRYNGPGNGDDVPVAIAVDSAGNVIVAGYSMGVGTNYDYAIIKYDSNGNQLWLSRYDSGIGVEDQAVAMALGPDSSIYVTGTSPGSTTGQDYITVRYDTNGNLLWSRRCNGAVNGNDWASDIAVDKSGNAFVTGWMTTSTGYGYGTVKYDRMGNQAWVRTYDGPAAGDDDAWAVGVDGSGNAYVTGQSQGVGSGYDYCTIKYDTLGNAIWVRRYDSGAMADDVARAIAVDDAGNVHVTGSTTNAAGWADCDTLKYDTNGNLVWVRRFDGAAHRSDVGNDIAVDAHGNVYVAGWAHVVTTATDYFTIAWSSSGTQMWLQTYDGPAAANDVANGIAVDGNGNVWTTGGSVGLGGSVDIATVKYSWTTLSGNVALESYSGGPGIPGVLEYRTIGTLAPVSTATIVLDASGNYTDPLAPVGTFDIACKFPNWLRQVVRGVVIAPSGGSASFSLTNGDADGSNLVDLLDLSTVLANFGSTGTPPLAGDVTWSGKVDLLDLSTILANFGKRGDL